MVGIKGVGMTALAEILVKNGVTVTGSDTDEPFFTDQVLRKAGIEPRIGFFAEHVPISADAVVYSTAYDSRLNAEIVEARVRGIRILSYPEAVGELTREHASLLVTGTHGKTTVSAMLAEALAQAGEDPLAIVGSRVRNWQGNALTGAGKFLVLEADEYQGKLEKYHPFAAILTSVDWDHPDFFPDPDSYSAVFRSFVGRIPRHGALVYSADSVGVTGIVDSANCRKVSYGFHRDADFRIVGYGSHATGTRQEYAEPGIRFEVMKGGDSLGWFTVRVPGRHNAQNATAVVALSTLLGVDLEAVRLALAGFAGTARRSERIGTYRGVPVYDDYAHHPEELRATLSAFRESYPDRRIVAVFHPHTYTRTKALLSEFSQSFDDAAQVIVLDIYGSAREAHGGVSSADLVQEINRYVPGKAEHIPTIPEAIGQLRSSLAKGDLLITFGAGDVWRVAEGVVGTDGKTLPVPREWRSVNNPTK